MRKYIKAKRGYERDTRIKTGKDCMADEDCTAGKDCMADEDCTAGKDCTAETVVASGELYSDDRGTIELYKNDLRDQLNEALYADDAQAEAAVKELYTLKEKLDDLQDFINYSDYIDQGFDIDYGDIINEIEIAIEDSEEIIDENRYENR